MVVVVVVVSVSVEVSVEVVVSAEVKGLGERIDAAVNRCFATAVAMRACRVSVAFVVLRECRWKDAGAGVRAAINQ